MGLEKFCLDTLHHTLHEASLISRGEIIKRVQLFLSWRIHVKHRTCSMILKFKHTLKYWKILWTWERFKYLEKNLCVVVVVNQSIYKIFPPNYKKNLSTKPHGRNKLTSRHIKHDYRQTYMIWLSQLFWIPRVILHDFSWWWFFKDVGAIVSMENARSQIVKYYKTGGMIFQRCWCHYINGKCRIPNNKIL